MTVGAQKGNSNAKGNKGGRDWSKTNRNKAVKLKGLVLCEAIRIMESKSESEEMKKLKEMVMNKILPTCLPRPIEISGEDGQPIILKFDNSFNEKSKKPI